MSHKLLKSLEMPNHLYEKLNSSRLFTIKDLVTKMPMDLVKLLNIPLSTVEALYTNALQNSANIEPVDTLTLYKSYQDKHIDFDRLDTFDTLLNTNELLKTGILTEICGPPGVGKTQFLLKTCSTHLLDPNNAKNSIIYIDTENNFNPGRLLEISRVKYTHNLQSEEDVLNMSKRVYVAKVFSMSDFNKKMEQLEREIIKQNTSLVIIDSLASLVRREFSGNNAQVYSDRSKFLTKISTYLKKIAQLLDVSMILTNQIVTCTTKGDSSNDIDKVSSENSVIPALGSTWSHFINIRIVLQYVNDEHRELLIAKSPVSPFRKYFYVIDKLNGLIFENCNEEYDGANPSFCKIRVKPYAN